MSIRKRCSKCGRFMHNKLHGACMSCLKSDKKLPLPPNLKILSTKQNQFLGKQKASIRGILNAVNTLILDGDWYCLKWNPISNLKKVLETQDDRPYLTPEMVDEIKAIIEEVENV